MVLFIPNPLYYNYTFDKYNHCFFLAIDNHHRFLQNRIFIIEYNSLSFRRCLLLTLYINSSALFRPQKGSQGQKIRYYILKLDSKQKSCLKTK